MGDPRKDWLRGQADHIAEAFHDAYERRAPEYGYKTREASAVPWDDVPEVNKQLMRATVYDLLKAGVIAASTDQNDLTPAEARLLAAEKRVGELEEALRDAIDFADEGWAYASPYFIEKWDYKGHREKLCAALSSGDEA